MAIFDEHVDWPGLERIREALRTVPPPLVAWTGSLFREGSFLDALRRDPGRPEFSGVSRFEVDAALEAIERASEA